MIDPDHDHPLSSSRPDVLISHTVIESSWHPYHHDQQQNRHHHHHDQGPKKKPRNVSEQVTNRRRRSTEDKGCCRVCVDCRTTKTPLWRSGPAGPKSLCNACGIRYRKKKRRHWIEVSVKEEKDRRFEGREEAEAAVLLMALSCGLLFHRHA